MPFHAFAQRNLALPRQEAYVISRSPLVSDGASHVKCSLMHCKKMHTWNIAYQEDIDQKLIACLKPECGVPFKIFVE